jgi:hypothetical protein
VTCATMATMSGWISREMGVSAVDNILIIASSVGGLLLEQSALCVMPLPKPT